jgi:lysyl endopeptidase
VKKALIILSLLISTVLNAQLERSGTPVSWNQELTVPIANEWVSEANVEQLLQEDAIHVEDRSVPYRFAYARPVFWNMTNSGSWFNLPNGDRLWILGIDYEGARSVSVTMSNLQLPKDGKLYVYSEDRNDYLGPLTDEDNRQTELCLPHVKGRKIFMEYYEPRSHRGEGSLELSYVTGAYRDPQAEAAPMQACAQWYAESDDVFQGARTGSSVMRVLVDHGQRYATAVLINNSSNNAEPFAVVPTQSIMGSVSSMVFQFGLSDLQCVLQETNCALQSICGAELVCIDETYGLALLRLHKSPPGEWDAYYAGWSLDNISESMRYCVQHPKGLAMSYSRYNDAFMPVIQGDATYMGLGGTGFGQTDGGSIGSPLLDSDWNVVGVFVGGNSRCTASGGIDRFVLLQDVWMTFRPFLDPLQSSTNRIPGMETPQFESEQNAAGELVVFPNPAAERIQIAGLEASDITALEVYDATGRILVRVQNTAAIDLTSLNDGVYALRIISPQGIFSKSLLVSKK